jgi:hypothetical protein
MCMYKLSSDLRQGLYKPPSHENIPMKFTNMIEISGLALLLALPWVVPACGGDDSDDGNDEVGDGDGDQTGDGDGDQTGDGDGDQTGDGDGDQTGDGDGDQTGDGDGDRETGMLRLIHLGVFPNDTNTTVDIFVNGAASGISISFKEGTDYVELPVGEYTFDIVPAGGSIDDSVLTVADFPISAGDMWEVIAAGYVAPDGDDAPFTVLAFPEDADGIPSGSTRLNVFHTGALAALTPVDVWVVDDNCDPVSPLLPDFEFGQVAGNVDVPSAPLWVGFDVGQDATVDACFAIPALGGDIMVNAFAVNDDAGNVSIVAHLPDCSIAELTPE